MSSFFSVGLSAGLAVAAMGVAQAHDHAPLRGRLVFADHQKPVVRVLDLDTGAVTEELPVPRANPVLVTAQDGRHVVIRTGSEDGAVRFLDTGIVRESHGDHDDIEKGPVRLLDLTLKGDNPVHVVSEQGWIGVYYDGRRPWDGPSESRAVFVEQASLGKDQPRLLDWKSPGPQHGIAFAMDKDRFLISQPNAAYVKGDDRSASSRPDRFDIFAPREGGSWTIAARLTEGCRLYHGHASTGPFHAFGCAESGPDGGILTLRAEGKGWKAERLAYPDGRRSSTIKAAQGGRFMVANYGSTSPYDAFLRIDTRRGSLDAADVLPVPGGQATCHFAVSARGNRLVNLTPDGMLRIHDIASWKELAAFQAVPAFDCAFGAKTPTPTLALSGASAFVSDPLNGQIREYHLDTLKQGLDVPVGGQPANLASGG